MAQAPTPSHRKSATNSGSQPLTSSIKQRFLDINQDRLRRTREAMRPECQFIIDLLPFLFHYNHPSLPGFMSEDTPAGIVDYVPPRETIELLRRVGASETEVRRKAIRRFDIEAIFFMGSGGTIAYTDKSDFDAWLCVRSGLEPHALKSLGQKAQAIEKWADSLKIELHFFVMEAERFRRGEQEDLSTESSGSAQYRLLLDEFYRTGLHLAGRYPAWWEVPPDQEEVYDRVLETISKEDQTHLIDFGSVARISAGEFYGASVWQVYKGIDSPYKSVLKILLMEAYVAQYPTINLLSLTFKKAVYAEENPSVDELDPYLLLYQRLESHLTELNEPDLLDLTRRCFYFKMNLRLTDPNAIQAPPWRYHAIKNLVDQWGWDTDYLKVLDSRKNWKLNRIQEERAALVEAITRSYHALSDFARQHADELMITADELNILGKKLYAAFERKAGKIEFINPGISENPTEDYLFFQKAGQSKEVWGLYRENISDISTVRDPANLPSTAKKARSIIELCTWCSLNGLIGDQTIYSPYPANPDIQKEIRAVVEVLNKIFSNKKIFIKEMALFREPPKVYIALAFINVCRLDAISRRSSQSIHMASGKIDVFCYGVLGENLLESVDLVMINSWKEVLTFRYTSHVAILDYVCDYLNYIPDSLSRMEAPISPTTFCFSSARSTLLVKRAEELINDVIQAFYQSEHGKNVRYIMTLQHTLYLIAYNEAFEYLALENVTDLIQKLSEPRHEYSPVVIDRYALDNTPFPTIFAASKPGIVSFFYLPGKGQADIYIIDERCSLFFQRAEFVSTEKLLNHFGCFFESILPRRHHLPFKQGSVVFYKIVRDSKTAKFKVEPRENHTISQSYFHVQVIGEKTGGGIVFTIYCAGREFSSIEYGEELFKEIATHILHRRKSGERYPIYITDIDITRMLSSRDTIGGIQTIHFLKYKKRIEDRINEALISL